MANEPYNPSEDDGEPGAVKLRGVKRFNNVPLLAGGGGLVLVLSVLMFAMMGRVQQQDAKQSEGEDETVIASNTSVDELFPEIPDGVIAPKVIKAATIDPNAILRPERDANGDVLPLGSRSPYGIQPETSFIDEEREIYEKAKLDAIEYSATLELRDQRAHEQRMLAASGSQTALSLSGLDHNLSAERNSALLQAGLPSSNQPPPLITGLTGLSGAGSTPTEDVLGSLQQARERLTQEINPAASGLPQLAGTTNAFSAILPPNLSSFQGGLQGGDQNRQADKQDFLDNQPIDVNYLETRLVKPVSPYELKQGTVIPSIMISGLNSDLPGRMIGQVSQDVYDTATGEHLLIPQGARLFGRYDSSVSFGQSRILVAWTRIILPNGQAIDIQGMPGTDRLGIGGFNDKVNRHYVRLYGNAVLLSLISGGLEAARQGNRGGTGNDNIADAITQSFGDVFSRVATAQVERELNVQPTLEVRPGYRFNILVDSDIILQPYED